MKYIALLAVFLIAWLIVDRVLFKDTRPGRRFSVRDSWRDLRSNIHIAVGIVAALILIISFLRLVFQAWVGE